MDGVELFSRSFQRLLFVYLVLFSASCVAQQFPHSSFSVEYDGISASCTEAMNATLACDDALGSVSLNFVWLDEIRLQSVCANTCFDDLEKARLSIQSACTASTDVIVEGNRAYPATYVLDNLIYTFNVTCRKDA